MNSCIASRRRTDESFRLASNLRSRLTIAMRNNIKSGSAIRDLGCSIESFKHYIEELWLSGMTWGNYGSHWVLDHIVPVIAFDLTNRREFLMATNYRNIQPMWSRDNAQKNDKLDWTHEVYKTPKDTLPILQNLSFDLYNSVMHEKD